MEKKNTERGITIPNFETDSITAVIKTVWDLLAEEQTGRSIQQILDPRNSSASVWLMNLFTKARKQLNGGSIVLLTNGIGIIVYPYTKRRKEFQSKPHNLNKN